VKTKPTHIAAAIRASIHAGHYFLEDIANASASPATRSGGLQQHEPATTLATSADESLTGHSVGSGVFASMTAAFLRVEEDDAAAPAGHAHPDLLAMSDDPEVVGEIDAEGTDAANDEAVADAAPADPSSNRGKQFRKDAPLHKQVIAPRIVAARCLNGVRQQELALALGYTNGAQLNQWEMGRRPIPLGMLVRVASELGVSMDYLVGLSDDHERDPLLARRSALHRSVRCQLDTVVDALAGAFERHAATTTPIEVSHLLRVSEQAVAAVNGFVEANQEAMLDMPKGAPVLRAIHDLAEVTAVARERMDRHAEFEAQLHASLKQTRFGS